MISGGGMIARAVLFFIWFILFSGQFAAADSKDGRFTDNKNGTVSDSKTGLLFSPYDEIDISQKVEELFENYEKFQINTRIWAETYSWSSSAKQVSKIYDELI